MKNITIVDQPLVIDSLAHLRDRDTGIQNFRFYSNKICKLLFAEAIRGLEMTDSEVTTPVKETHVQKISGDIVIVSVLRAGLAMLSGSTSLLPLSKVGFVGLTSENKTSVAKEYYWKLPELTTNSIIVITDPMLASGGTILHILRKLAKSHQVKSIRVVCVISTPEGINAIHAEFPDVQIYTAAIDKERDSQGFIIPGLGDYGDRYFGTI